MKKKILIISHAMEIGGAERALLGLLNSFDYSNYEVDLFLFRHEGELFSFIPKEVNILPVNQSQYLAIPIKELIKKHAYKMLYGRFKGKMLAKRRIKKLGLRPENQVSLTYSHKYTYSYIDFINPNTEYDLAISFLTPHYICLNKCNAKLKIAWIHTDYSTIDIDVETELEMWKEFKYIISISDDCTKSFVDKFPTLEKKIVRIDNIITNEMIRNQADVFSVEEEMKAPIKLLSIGRFTYQKNFDNVPEICKIIIEKGLDVKWYLIGFGPDEELIKNKIKESGMEFNVIILGKKLNPYPYIKACDFYIQPSRYEGKAVTVREAQILKKPVIITNYATSSSQLTHNYDGVIVEMENKKCAQEIYDFIKSENNVNKIVCNLENTDYSNESEIQKLYDLMGD